MTLIPFNDLLFGKSKKMVKTASTTEAKDHAADAGDQTKKMEGQNYDPYEKAQKDSQAERDKQMKLANDPKQIISALLDAGHKLAQQVSEGEDIAMGYEGEGMTYPELSDWDVAASAAQQFLGQGGPPDSLPGSEPDRADPGSIGMTAAKHAFRGDPDDPDCLMREEDYEAEGDATLHKPPLDGQKERRKREQREQLKRKKTRDRKKRKDDRAGPGSYASFPEFDKEAGCEEPKKKPWDKDKDEEDDA